ncbi:MAG: nucleoside deaminase [Nitratireductor sp.]
MSNFMEQALIEAKLAGERGEVPVGAVLVKDKAIIAKAGNRTLELKDPTAHAEILVLREAGKLLNSERLIGCDLYVTLEPCPMCAAAISFARIRRLYFGAQDTKSGGVENGVHFFSNASCHHAPEVYSGFSAQEASDLLKSFFKEKRS